MPHSWRLAGLFIGLAAATSAAVEEAEAIAAFAAYKQRHGKAYSGRDEEALRFVNFLASAATVAAHNGQPGRSFRMGLNQFSDMSEAEFEAKVLMKPQDCSATSGRSFVSAPPAASLDLPAHVDWRERGVIGEVKNQGHCGSCWTFSTSGCLEAHLALKYDAWRSPRLSEQQLVECAQAFDNHGCEGGLPSHAFEYVRHAGGLSTEFSYPYRAKDGPCRFNRSSTPETSPFRPTSMGVGVEVPGGAVNLTQGDEAALKYFLATRGPAMKNMCGIANCNSFPDLYGINAAVSNAKAAEVMV